MCQGNIPVESITIEEALRDFLPLITKVESSERNENQINVLISHNSAMLLHFADSLHLIKNLIKNEHKALELDSSGYCT